ncbi:MAG TPA: endoribonuclease MazF [Bacteroidetes bacterium]|nr:endoribonuclease MazF [Bacteroidota bacterium]HCN37223.1 endoribonuclease MazF [Bacteroidota bacterium]
MKNYIPEQKDIVWINFDPQAGNEQKGKRPALILSPSQYNEKTNLAICVPITSKIKGYSFEVKIPIGLKVSGVILSDHVKSLDWKIREAKFIDKLPDFEFNEVIEKLSLLLKVYI